MMNPKMAAEIKRRKMMQQAGPTAARTVPAMPAPPSVKPPMGMKKGGMVKESSGSASKRADGVASKGKTKGTMVKMAGGGKC
jgi:hypothetical protein